MTPEQKRLADRILKLLALASSTTFAAEAASARALAAELMRAHNIAPGVAGKPAQSDYAYRLHIPFGKGMRWELIITEALGMLCSCCVFFQDHIYGDEAPRREPSNNKLIPVAAFGFKLVGTIGNLDMLEYMLAEVGRQRAAAWMNYKMQRKPDSFHKFCFGFARALMDRIRGLVDWETMRAEQARAKAWYEEHFGKVTDVHLHHGRASSEAGMAAGAGASLTRGALAQPYKQIGHRK